MNKTAKNAKDARNSSYLTNFPWRSWRFTFLLFIAISPVAGAAEPGALRVMSFNIRFARAGHSEEAVENNWADPNHPRRERVVRVIREAAPDLLGVQEARHEQIEDLRDALPEYEFYGIGRDDGKTEGEYSGIYFRKARFSQKDAGSFWLSATPEKAGTTFSFNKLPRIASWVRLTDNKSNRELVLLNMHWDHQDKTAHETSATLVLERLATLAKRVPVIVMGDLNTTEDTPAYKLLLRADVGLADSYRKLHPARSPDEASFGGWTGLSKGSRIDFILHTTDLNPVAAEILRTSYDGRWPSDHYPVTATLTWR
jgi:endonuclease/exonuclease/phosphatase family metal-dependent hydrolase